MLRPPLQAIATPPDLPPFFGDTTGGDDRLEATPQELILESPHRALAALRVSNDLDFLQQENVDIIAMFLDEPDRGNTRVGIEGDHLDVLPDRGALPRETFGGIETPHRVRPVGLLAGDLELA